MENLVSVEWLRAHLNDENIIILDASIKKVTTKNDTNANDTIIPNSRFFDIKNSFSDTNSDFPNTIPSPKKFQEEAQKLGINNDSTIVIYDNKGIYSSPRAWWLLKTMGHEKVFVLNGGLPEWQKQGFKTELKNDTQAHKSGNFVAKLKKENIKYYEDILCNIESGSAILIDARSNGRFNGTSEEPRKTLKSGSIPNSINIPFMEFIEEGKLKPSNEIKRIFDTKVESNQPIIFSCGSGVTACINLLASEECNLKNIKHVYDGSWTEWAIKQNLINS